MATLHARGQLAVGDDVPPRGHPRHGLHRPAGRGDQVGAVPRRSCRRSPARPGSPGFASYVVDPTDPVPGRVHDRRHLGLSRGPRPSRPSAQPVTPVERQLRRPGSTASGRPASVTRPSTGSISIGRRRAVAGAGPRGQAARPPIGTTSAPARVEPPARASGPPRRAPRRTSATRSQPRRPDRPSRPRSGSARRARPSRCPRRAAPTPRNRALNTNSGLTPK